MKNLANTHQVINRDIRFDVLKAIGIICIMIAHTNPPDLIFQLRNFDVPLMVMASGSLFYYSSYNRDYSFWKYFSKRIPRLLAPVWLFFIFFFATSYITYPLLNRENQFSPMAILATLSLGLIRAKGEVDLVWIIRVFILIAAVSPLILKLRKRLATDYLFLAVLIGAYILYEIIFFQVTSSQNPILQIAVIKILIVKILFYIVPYGCVFGLGMTITRLDKKNIAFISIICLLIFLITAIVLGTQAGAFVLTQEYKSPPTFYYLSYAIFASLALYLLVDKFQAKFNFLRDFIIFASSSSLWIYLWHFFFIEYWQIILPRITSIANNFIVYFLGITILSMSITYWQKQLVSRLIRTTKFGQKNAELLSTLFLK